MGSIPLPALDIKTPQQPDLLQKYGQLQQLRNSALQTQMAQQEAPLRLQALQQQTQLGAGQVQLQQQQIKDKQAMTAAMQNWDGKDYTQLPALVIKNGGSAEAVMGLKKQILDQQTAIATQVKDQGQGALAQIEATNKKNDLITGALAPLTDASQVPDAQLPQMLTSTVQSLVQQGALDPQHAAAAQQLLQSGDPTAIRQGIDHFRKTLMAQSQITDDVAKQAATQASRTAAAKNQAEIDYYAKNGGAPGVSEGIIQQNDWLTKHPGKTASDYVGAKAAQEESARLPGEMALAAQRQALSQGDPKTAAQLLVNGDATLSELKARGATPDFIARTLFAANKLSGGKYNAQSADAQFQVAKSPANVAFFGSANSLTEKGGTLDQLQAAAKQIPGEQIPVFNSIADVEKAATGSGPIAKYASVLLGVADDYSKVMGGGQGSDTSRAQALKLIPANASPEAREAAIEGIRGAVGSQITSRIGNNPVLGRMYARPNSSSQASSPATAPTGTPVGTKKQFPNGKTGVWDGHGWVAQ